MTAQAGTFSDHNSLGNSLNSQRCMWLIKPWPPVDSITLIFDRFATERNYDFVKVYDGDDTDLYHLIGEFSGTLLPPPVVATSGVMTVVFETDATIERRGFRATYRSSNCTNKCSGNGTCYDGVCHCDIGYGGSDCSQNACTHDCWNNGQCSTLNQCICDDPWYGLDCGTCTASSCQTSYCSGSVTLTTPNGTFSEHNGPGNYLKNSNCKWVIEPTVSRSSIVLTFTTFDLAIGQASVRVFERSPTTGTHLIGKFEGFADARVPPPLITSNPQSTLLVEFFSSSSDNVQTGFIAVYTTVNCPQHCSSHGVCGLNSKCSCYPGYTGEDCSATECVNECSGNGDCVNNKCECFEGFYGVDCLETHCSGETTYRANSGAITDHVHGIQYLPNSQCAILIQPETTTSSIGILFTKFQLEFFYDTVRIYNGPDTNSPLIGIYSGSFLPPPIKSTSGSVLVEFFSDYSIEFEGWELKYSRIEECPNSCSFNGICIDGQCICDAGKAGVICSENAPLIPLPLDLEIQGSIPDYHWAFYSIEVDREVSQIEIQAQKADNHGNPTFYVRQENYPNHLVYDFYSPYWADFFIRQPKQGTYILGIYANSSDGDVAYSVKASYSCPKCVNGKCKNYVCECDPCWSGFTCAEQTCNVAAGVAVVLVIFILCIVCICVVVAIVYQKKKRSTLSTTTPSVNNQQEMTERSEVELETEAPTHKKKGYTQFEDEI